MKILFSVFVVTLCVQMSFAFDAETERIIDDYVENVFMQNHQIPGVSLSVVRNGTVLLSKGYGMRNVSAGLSSDADTLFAIGSITKSFVAVLVVKTLSEMYPRHGAAVLDIPLAELIPPTVNFTLSDRYRAEHTSFRDLLSHRTCLFNSGLDLILGTVQSESEYAYRSRFLPEVCEFRNGFVYNNHMLSLAGETIAAIAGSTLQSMIISLANDIGMTNTTYMDFNGTFESLPRMSQPYILKNNTLVEFDIYQLRKVHMALGAGGVLSSANDMAKYMEFHLSRGRVLDRQIVPSNVMDWLYSVSNPLDFEGGRTESDDFIGFGTLGVAHGFFSGLYDGWSHIHHSGYWPPYHSEMSLFPATKIGVFVSINGPGAIISYPLHQHVALNIFEWVRQTNQTSQILPRKIAIEKPLIEHQLFRGGKTNRSPTALHHSRLRNRVQVEDVVGVYGHPYDGDLSIRLSGPGNETLQIYFSNWAFGSLHPITGSNTTFSIEWHTTILDHFHSYPEEIPDFWVDFSIVDAVLFRGGQLEFYIEFEFVKNATLDTFPAVPWTPTSCGPKSRQPLN